MMGQAEMLWNIGAPSTLAEYVGLAGKLCREHISHPTASTAELSELDRILSPGGSTREDLDRFGVGMVITTIPTGISVKRFGIRKSDHHREFLAGLQEVQEKQIAKLAGLPVDPEGLVSL